MTCVYAVSISPQIRVALKLGSGYLKMKCHKLQLHQRFST